MCICFRLGKQVLEGNLSCSQGDKKYTKMSIVHLEGEKDDTIDLRWRLLIFKTPEKTS